jgi:ABC-type multidrug transport system fused ATPase/permease subunit
MNNSFRDLPRYLKIFQKYLGKKIYIIFGLSLFAALSEGLGILMLLPLMENLDHQSGVTSDNVPTESASNFAYEIFSALGLQGSTTAILFFIALAFVFKGFLVFGALATNAYYRGHLHRKLKGRLFSHYRGMSYSYYAEKDTGHFINLINDQTARALQSFYHLSQFGTHLVNLLIYLSFGFLIAWSFGLMAITSGLVLLLLFKWLNEYVREISRKTATENGELSKLFIQMLHGFKYLVATGQIKKTKKEINKSIDLLTDYQIRTGMAGSLTYAAREPIAVVFVMTIIFIQLVYFGEPLAPILVSILLFYRSLNTTLGIQNSWQHTLEFIGSMELLHNEFKVQKKEQEKTGSTSITKMVNSINFKDVDFYYGSKKGNILNDVSLSIKAKTTIAFVGKSGSGKSTIIDLITLMLKPCKGSVLIDDVKGSDIDLESWRRQLGYVSQEAVIFNDTVANNISMWSNINLEMKSIKEAAKQANIDNFIESLPQGYETIVGDRGMRLSGGQRQRLFIARELFRKPNLLMLDEATSALDSESEFEIQKSIENLRGYITVIIVAHRLSTVKSADCIYVLDNGFIVEKGSYKDLQNTKDSHFSRLVELQSL